MNLLNLGNINALNDENKKTFASTKGLPYLNVSGIYDAVIASAHLKAINVKGQMKNVVNVSFVVDVQHENTIKNAQLWLTLDLPPSNYANHLIDLAFLCGCVSQTGEIVLNQEVKQLEKPLSNGETTITHFPQLEQKKVRVAVARTSKADNGTPYFSIRSFFNTSNQTALEQLKGLQPAFIQNVAKSLNSESDSPFFEPAPKNTATNNAYGNFGANQNIYGQSQTAKPQAQTVNAYQQQPQAQSQTAYGQQTMNAYQSQPQQQSAQVANAYQPQPQAVTNPDEMPF